MVSTCSPFPAVPAVLRVRFAVVRPDFLSFILIRFPL